MAEALCVLAEALCVLAEALCVLAEALCVLAESLCGSIREYSLKLMFFTYETVREFTTRRDSRSSTGKCFNRFSVSKLDSFYFEPDSYVRKFMSVRAFLR